MRGQDAHEGHSYRGMLLLSLQRFKRRLYVEISYTNALLNWSRPHYCGRNSAMG